MWDLVVVFAKGIQNLSPRDVGKGFQKGISKGGFDKGFGKGGFKGGSHKGSGKEVGIQVLKAGIRDRAFGVDESAKSSGMQCQSQLGRG